MASLNFAWADQITFIAALISSCLAPMAVHISFLPFVSFSWLTFTVAINSH
jgi:hypothetical protein